MSSIRRFAVPLLAVILLGALILAAGPGQAAQRVEGSISKLRVEVKAFGLVSRAPEFGRSTYQMTVLLTNGGTVPLGYRAAGVIAAFTANHTLGANGNDTGTIRPGASVELTRDFTVLDAVARDLKAAGGLTVRCRLALEITGRWALWSVERGVDAAFEHSMLFD